MSLENWHNRMHNHFAALAGQRAACGGGIFALEHGLQGDEILGIYADEDEARLAGMELLGDFPVRPQDALFAEVVVHVMVKPNDEEMTAKELANAAVEAVRNAVRQGEEAGFRHGLQGQVSLGAGTVDLRNQTVAVGG